MTATHTSNSAPTPAPVTAPRMLNGLEAETLEGTPQMLAEQPAQGRFAFETHTTWLEGVRSISRVSGFEAAGERIERHHAILSDEPLEIFGKDIAPNPQELLLSAVGACLSASYAIQATLAGITLRSLAVDARGALDIRGPLGLDPNVPRGYPEVTFRITVDADANREQLEELHAAATAGSPNFYHLSAAIPTKAELVVVG